MAVHPHLVINLGDVEILADDAPQRQRTISDYCSAYNAISLPFMLPIPSSEPTDNPSVPILIDERAKANRAPSNKTKKKSAAIKRETVPDILRSPRGSVMPLFHSANSRAPLDLPPEAATKDLNDVVFNTGGPVWALDWCPVTADDEGQERAAQFLLVGAHPKGKEKNPIGKASPGKGIVQIWEIQHVPQPPAVKAALPRLAMGLCHDRGVLWDAKWCPNPAAGDIPGNSLPIKRLGLLAAVFGNGDVQVLAVPHPDSLASLGVSAGASSSTAPASQPPVFMRLKAKLSASPKRPECLGCCLEWLPTQPHDLLLVGCWDGSVLVYNIPQEGGPSGQLLLLRHFLADPLPIRFVSWAPVTRPDQHLGACDRSIFCSSGFTGAVKIWDIRDVCQPEVELATHTSWVTSGCWLAEPQGILLTQDDGALRWAALNPFTRPKHEHKTQGSWWGGTIGAIWSCHVSPISGHVAYAGDGGEVVVAVPRFMIKSRIRPPHIVISSTRLVDRVVCMMGQEPARETVGSKLPVVKGDIANPSAAVYKVRWSCGQSNDPGATWVASGGATGIVRCQRISFYATF